MEDERLNREAKDLCRRVLGDGANPIDDARLPAPDVMGYLADRNIRRHDLDRVAKHVAETWPQVAAVRCGVSGSRPYFSIHIEPFSRAAQRAHWPLGDWIEAGLDTSACDFLFLPVFSEEKYSPRISVYEREGGTLERRLPEAA